MSFLDADASHSLPHVALDVAQEVINAWSQQAIAAAGDVEDIPTPNATIRDSIAALFDASTASDDMALSQAASTLYPVAAQANFEDQRRLLNSILSSVGVSPLCNSDRTITWSSTSSPMLAALAVALLEAITVNHAELGICRASHCADVLIDRSPGHRRAYCSLSCQNRTRQAAFRARHGSKR